MTIIGEEEFSPIVEKLETFLESADEELQADNPFETFDFYFDVVSEDDDSFGYLWEDHDLPTTLLGFAYSDICFAIAVETNLEKPPHKWAVFELSDDGSAERTPTFQSFLKKVFADASAGWRNFYADRGSDIFG